MVQKWCFTREVTLRLPRLSFVSIQAVVLAAASVVAVASALPSSQAPQTNEERIAVLSSNAMADKRFSKSKSVHDLGIRSTLCVPIKSRKLDGKSGEEVVGVIYILLWEGSIATYAASADRLSIAAYGRAMVAEQLPQSAAGVVSPATAAVILLVATVAGALLGARALTRTELP